MATSKNICLTLNAAGLSGLLVFMAGCAALPQNDSEFDLPASSQALANRSAELGMDTPLAQLMADPSAQAILVAYDPDLALSPDAGLARDCSLNFLSHFPQTGLTPTTMTKIEAALKKLNSHPVIGR